MQLSIGKRDQVVKAINRLFGEQFPESEMVTAMMSLMENDLTFVKSFARFMKIDITIFSGIMGCISGDEVALKPFIKKLGKKLGFKESAKLYDLLKLASGEIQAIDRLNQKMN